MCTAATILDLKEDVCLKTRRTIYVYECCIHLMPLSGDKSQHRYILRLLKTCDKNSRIYTWIYIYYTYVFATTDIYIYIYIYIYIFQGNIPSTIFYGTTF